MILNVCEVQRRTQAYKMNILNHSFQKFQSQFFVHPLSYLRPAAELTSSVLEISGQTRKDTKEPIYMCMYGPIIYISANLHDQISRWNQIYSAFI